MSPAVAAFLQAVHGIPAHHVAKALNTLTPGADWVRCGKAHMAQRYDDACNRPTESPWDKGLKRIDLQVLACRAKARQEGLKNWDEVGPGWRASTPPPVASVATVPPPAPKLMRDIDKRPASMWPGTVNREGFEPAIVDKYADLFAKDRVLRQAWENIQTATGVIHSRMAELAAKERNT